MAKPSRQDLKETEILCRSTYILWKQELSQFSSMSPSLHRALQHTMDYMKYFNSLGITLGESSEQGIEASNYDSKHDRESHSYRGTHRRNNIDCFHRSWWTSDPQVISFHDFDE